METTSGSIAFELKSKEMPKIRDTNPQKTTAPSNLNALFENNLHLQKVLAEKDEYIKILVKEKKIVKNKFQKLFERIRQCYFQLTLQFLDLFIFSRFF